MIISDVMTTNVVSISSDAALSQARKIMDTLKYSRLPVIDKGKLVGVVTRDALDKMGPSQLTTFSVHELAFLLNSVKVKDVMRREVVTVPPGMVVEDAVAIAQKKGVGMLIVTEGEKVVGVATTTDFFYKILNPILGIDMPGTRIYIRNCYKTQDIYKVMDSINKLNIEILSLFLINLPEVGNTHDLVAHLNCVDSTDCVNEIQKLGFRVDKK
jgi:acetoin utilization protein AcuB